MSQLYSTFCDALCDVPYDPTTISLLVPEAVRGHARLKLDRLAWMTGDMDAGAQRRSNARFGANAGWRAYQRANGPRHWARSHGGHYD